MINARRQALFYSNTETLTQKRWRDTMGVKTKLECLPVFITPLTFGWTPKLVGFRAKADGNAQRLAARGANSSILLLGWEFQLLRGKLKIHRRVRIDWWPALGISSSDRDLPAFEAQNDLACVKPTQPLAALSNIPVRHSCQGIHIFICMMIMSPCSLLFADVVSVGEL